MALLEIENLGVNFALPYRTLAAVKGASFALDKGETLALVGESGSGKTVTALSILQLLPAASASHPAGSSIRFDGAELVGAPESELRHIRGGRIAMIFQEPMTSLNPLHTVAKQIGEALWLHKRMNGKAARDRTVELLRLVGLPDAENRLQSYPHQLSGGQRQRVMIAMALANEPDLLIADEPTTALDVTVQAQILKLLKDLQARFGMALLLITHDLGVVRKMADRVCVMTQGEIVEAGAVREVFDRPRHPYTRHLLDAQPKGAPVVPADGTPVLMDSKEVKVWFPIKTGLFRRVTGFIKAVDGIDLAVRAGETLGVVGESGSGKTTLGLALLRLVESEGAIVYDGKHLDQLTGRTMRPLRRELQIVFQDPIRACRRVSPSVRSSRKGSRCIVSAATQPAAAAWSRTRSMRWPCRATSSIAIRTNSLAACGSASPSRASWRCDRVSSSSTSRPRRSTCRCRRRWSTCCAICSGATTSPICSSATICAW